MINDEELPSAVGQNSMLQNTESHPSITMNNAPNAVMFGVNHGPINLGPDQAQIEDIVKQTISRLFANGDTVREVPPVNHALEWNSLSSERFNIFVLENEEFNHNVFSMSKAKSMEQYTNEDDYQRYRLLTPDVIAELCSMPCIFAKRNKYFNRTDSSHPALLGKIKSIKNQGDTIQFEFKAFQTISQQTLNENVILLGIAYASLRNEFDEEHWSVKRGNLLSSLAHLGVEVR